MIRLGIEVKPIICAVIYADPASSAYQVLPSESYPAGLHLIHLIRKQLILRMLLERSVINVFEGNYTEDP